MDLSGSECCSPDTPAKDDTEEVPETMTLPRFDGIKEEENNGSCGGYEEVLGLQRVEEIIKTSSLPPPQEPKSQNGKLKKPIAIGIGIEEQQQPLDPQPSSPPPPPPPLEVTPTHPTSTTTPNKGYGLKKWRRIRRDSPKEGTNSMDLNKMGKRGLSIVAEPSAEINPKSEGSVASSVSAIKGSNPDSRLAAGSTFPVSTDSENSEDRSSKSSTAASAPKLRYDVSKIKHMSGKVSGSSVQKVQQGKSRVETSKKSRAERFKIDKENSFSSLESDSRSSNALFAQMGNFSRISNGRQSKKSSNYDDGENSDEAHVSELQSSDEVQIDYGKENGVEVEDVSQDDVAADVSSEVKEEEEGDDNHQPITDQDPLADSIISLLSVQESLESEIEKFGEIGWENGFLPDDSIPSHLFSAKFASVDPETCEFNSSVAFCFEEIEPSSLPHLGVQLIGLEQSISRPESNPEGASAVLKAKENRGESLKKESGSTLNSPQEFRLMKIELEDLIKQKIEAEVEYLVITRTTQNLKVPTVDRISLIEEQKSLLGEQTQLLQKLRDAKRNAVVLKRQAEELEVSCGKLLGTEEILGMQNGVYKFTFCFLIQLVLLLVALGIFLLKLLPHSVGFVPT